MVSKASKMKSTASQCDIWQSNPWCSTPEKVGSTHREPLISSPIREGLMDEEEVNEEELEPEPEPDMDDEEYKPSDESFREAQAEEFLKRYSKFSFHQA